LAQSGHALVPALFLFPAVKTKGLNNLKIQADERYRKSIAPCSICGVSFSSIGSEKTMIPKEQSRLAMTQYPGNESSLQQI